MSINSKVEDLLRCTSAIQCAAFELLDESVDEHKALPALINAKKLLDRAIAALAKEVGP